MLVLNRTPGEKISIADGLIIVQVIRVSGNKVLLGIEAPPDINVHRQDVQDAIDRQVKELSQ